MWPHLHTQHKQSGLCSQIPGARISHERVRVSHHVATATDTTPERPPQLTCFHCRYDLTGLPADGPCPECAAAIAHSIAHREEIEQRLRNRLTPLPGWLRMARSGVIAAWITLLTSPFYLRPLARTLGYPIIVRNAFVDALFGVFWPLAMATLAVFALIAITRKNPHPFIFAACAILYAMLLSAAFGE